MKNLLRSGRRIWTDMIALILALVMIVIVAAQFSTRTVFYGDTAYDLSSGWVTEDGQSISLNEAEPGVVTLTHALSDMALTDKCLCLKSSDTFLDISIDGELVYHYAPTHRNVIGHSYGNYIHTIHLPADAQEVSMTLTPIYRNDTADIRFASVEDPAGFIVRIFRQGIPGFTACLIMVVFGIIMILLEITGGRIVSDQPMGFLPLGVFSVIIGIWSMNDTYVLQVITGRPAIIKVLGYLCMMLIAYPPVSFIATAAKKRSTPLLPVLVALIAVNFLTTIILAGAGLVDPHYMLLFSHANIVIAMCMTVFLMVQAVRNKQIENRFLITIVIGMTAALIGVGIDLIRFWFVRNSEYGASPFTRAGVLIFIIAEGIHLLREKNRLLIEQGNAEMMKKLAYSDALTKLPNRAAYYEKEESLRKTPQKCAIIMLDINWLKKANDEFGHAEGDRHIIAAAGVIRKCLSALGTCYRIGGDEFAAILDTGDVQAVEQALAGMEQAAADYNRREKPPVPLQLAYGYAIYAPEEMELDAAQNTADQRMYDMKRMMKAIR